MKAEFIPHKFYAKTASLIAECDAICTMYFQKNYTLTLRQLFYQLVTRNRIANTVKEYKNLGQLISDARYAGLIDWEHITDRVRVIQGNQHWAGPEDIIHSASETLTIDTWVGQKYRPEVWIEKDALIELARNVCEPLDIHYIAVKAYSSTSAMWDARKRFREYVRDGQTPLILHLGDHDYTGDDCSRHLKERMELLTEHPVELRRLALNRDQIDKYDLPPQPGKNADPRFRGYVAKHKTTHVWELDALMPDVIERIIEDGIRQVLDEDLRSGFVAEQAEGRKLIGQVSENWPEITDFLQVVSNGQRAGYEAWRYLQTPESILPDEHQTTKIGYSRFSPPAPVRTNRDAAIAEEMALAIMGIKGER